MGRNDPGRINDVLTNHVHEVGHVTVDVGLASGHREALAEHGTNGELVRYAGIHAGNRDPATLTYGLEECAQRGCAVGL